MQRRPITTVAQFDRWEVYRMEVHIVLTHELEQTDILRVEPPPFPFRGVIGRDAHISDGGIKLENILN